MKIWIDADACPRAVKEVIYKASFRLNFEVVLVANSYMSIPEAPHISLIQVEQGPDQADLYISENVQENDVAITADIPLAAEVVKKKAIAINPRGEVYTEENAQERLSMRDFMQDLRDSGIDTGGPSSFGPKDKEKFANSFNKILTKLSK